MTAQSVSRRTMIAQRCVQELAVAHAPAQVWLVGPLAVGLAHAHSDIDMLVVTSRDPSSVAGSRLVDGIRVDVTAVRQQELDDDRAHLQAFDVTFDDIDSFRRVRRRLPELTRLHTARRLDGESGSLLLADQERAVYRNWALADRVETAMSLTEDLFGLLLDGHIRGADIVWRQVCCAVAGAQATAAHHPLLGDKWLPCLIPHSWAEPDPLPAENPLEAAEQWFHPIQERVLAALMSAFVGDFAGETSNPSPRLQAGWLPQRYADGWFARFADHRVRLSASEPDGWHTELARSAQKLGATDA